MSRSTIERHKFEGLTPVRGIIDRLRTVTSANGLHALMEEVCDMLGFRYFALIHHCDLRVARPGVININNYPAVWADYFIERQLYRIDPAVQACCRTSAPFSWSDLGQIIHLDRRHQRILSGAAREGLEHGLTIPAGVLGECHGSCSFGGADSGDVLERHFFVGHVVGAFGFEMARRIASGTAGKAPSKPTLSPRQRDCAVLAGRGLKDLAIAGVLGLSYKTVVNYLAAARERYSVHTREQLVIRAVLDGDIYLSELDTCD